MSCQVKDCMNKSVVIVHYPTNLDEVELCQNHYNRWIYKEFKYMPVKKGVLSKK